MLGRDSATTLGAQVRHDRIDDVGLFRTKARTVLNTVRSDEVQQTSLSAFAQSETAWAEKFRSILGLRGDYYNFDVESDNPANSSNKQDGIVSPKIGFILGPWYQTEYYLNAGYGLHSNDARGTTTRVDPNTGAPTDPVDPLVRSKGAEVGLRSHFLPGLVTTLTLWYLELDSELLFIGDAGTTEASGASRRRGIEWTNFYQASRWLTLDADFAFSKAEFKDGGEVPGSVGQVIAAGATVDGPKGFYGTLRLRHVGDIPLSEDSSVQASPTTLLNLKLGWQCKRGGVGLDIFNLLDADDSDISYFYTSRLPGEPLAGVDDIHFHPVEPRTVRVTAFYTF